ncbi:MAG: FkbM family methyltransferase [Candidatus Yanofskybacteria bacterium]|nr:FkbM family methyltransferase [Candidatus Yanofskybacteria bacterium]
MSTLKALGTDLYRGISDVLFIFSYPRSLRKRLTLLVAATRICCKFFLARFFVFSHERFLGFRIAIDDYRGFARMFREIFVRRIYYFESSVPAPRVIDCGGNIGMSVLYVKWLYPHAHIDVFEPAAETVRHLRETIQHNMLDDVVVHHVAVGGADGELELSVPRHRGRSGGASLKGVFGDDAQEWLVERVPVETLSKYVKEIHPDFVKIDIEGSEGEVIQELSDAGVLAEIPEMEIEYHHGKATLSFGAFLQTLERAGLRAIIHGDDVDLPIFYLKKRKHYHSMVRAFKT